MVVSYLRYIDHFSILYKCIHSTGYSEQINHSCRQIPIKHPGRTHAEIKYRWIRLLPLKVLTIVAEVTFETGIDSHVNYLH